MGIFDKIKDAVGAHPDEVKQGIDKAGDFIDERTDGRFGGQVDQGQDFLRGQVENLGGGNTVTGDEAAPTHDVITDEVVTDEVIGTDETTGTDGFVATEDISVDQFTEQDVPVEAEQV